MVSKTLALTRYLTSWQVKKHVFSKKWWSSLSKKKPLRQGIQPAMPCMACFCSIMNVNHQGHYGLNKKTSQLESPDPTTLTGRLQIFWHKRSQEKKPRIARIPKGVQRRHIPERPFGSQRLSDQCGFLCQWKIKKLKN